MFFSTVRDRGKNFHVSLIEASSVGQWNGLLPPNGIAVCQTEDSIKQSKEEE